MEAALNPVALKFFYESVPKQMGALFSPHQHRIVPQDAVTNTGSND